MSKELYLTSMRPLRKYLREHMTNAEVYLWSFIRKKQLGYRFRRQASIGYFVVDFYCKELNLAIEIDGDIHLEQVVQKRDDIRQKIIELDSVVFLRFSNNNVLNDINNVLNTIKNKCYAISYTANRFY